MSFDFDLFVIGAGSGGVRAARFAAGFGARVAVAESRYLGGTCVNVGCVPKKLLVYGAHFSEDFEQARAYGWSAGEAQFDWATLIGNKNREIQRLNGIYRNLLVNSGVTLLEGHARLLDAHNVEVDGQRFSAKHILIATGGWPQVPDIPGKEHAITSNEAFFLERLPRRVLASSPRSSTGSAPRPPCSTVATCSCAASTAASASICATNWARRAWTCSSTATSPVSTNRPMVAWPRPSRTAGC